MVVFLLNSVAVLAQKKAKSNTPTSMDPHSSSTKVYAPKAVNKKKSSKTTFNAKDDFYDRLENNNKQRRKNEKTESKDQYSNFQYFGHKKAPKKRPPEKMKYCKICGIRH